MKVLRSGVLAGIVAAVMTIGAASAGADDESTPDPGGIVEFTAAPPDLTNQTTANFEFTTPGPATCRLDDGAARECSSPVSIPDLSDGPHTFTVTSEGGASATHQWTVDTSKPHLTFRHTIAGHTGNNIPTTNETSASFTFSTTDPTAELTCRIDPPVNYLPLTLSDGRKSRIPTGTGPFVPCVSPQAASGLSEGHHIAEVRATDRAGNRTSQGIIWMVDYEFVPPDTTPPAISIGRPEKIDPFTYEIPFTVSEQAELVCRLRVGNIVQPTSSRTLETCTSPITWTDIAEGQVSVMIEATDPSGNRSSQGRGWTVDRTPPEVRIKSAPDTVSGPGAVFRFSSSESATQQILECSLDDGPWRSCASPVELKGLAHGSHAFAIRATDGYGNTGEPTVIEWSVDALAPEARIASGPDRRTSSTAATFEIEAPPDTTSIECSLDGAAWGPCQSPVELTDLADGPHEMSVRAIDAVGNAGPVASREWSVDTTGPSITLGQTPPSPTSVATARFTWDSEPGTTFRCRVNSRSWGACSSPLSASSLPDGTNRFEVIGTDALGNQGEPAVFTWVVETPPPTSTPAPTVSITSGPPSLTSARHAEFVIDHTPGSILSCRSTLIPFPFTVAWKPCESPVVIAGFQDGNQTFEVRATSPEGRVSVVKGWSWRVDATAPPVTLKSKPLATTTTTLADFVFSSSDRTATFLCSLDRAPLGPCSSPVQLDGISPGGHTFEIIAVDPAGNRSAALRHEWEVVDPDPDYSIFGEIPFPVTEPDPLPDPLQQDGAGTEDGDPDSSTDPAALPVVSEPRATTGPRILSAPSKTASRRPLFRFTAPGPGSANLCSVDRTRPVGCTSSWRPGARLSKGTHIFRVRTRTADGTLSPVTVHRFRVTAGR